MPPKNAARKQPAAARAVMRGGRAFLAARGVHRGLAALWVMGAAAFLLLVMTVLGDHGVFRIRQMNRDRADLQARVANMEAETVALRRRLDDHRAGRVSNELVARERLGLVRPGEVVYDFRPDPLR